MNIETFLRLKDIDFSDNSIEAQIDMVEAITGKSGITTAEFLEGLEKVGEIFSSFNLVFKDKIEVGGRTLYFHRIEDMSTRQYVDYSELSKGDDKANFSTLLAIIYTDDDGDSSYASMVVENKELIEKHLEAGEGLAAMNFFVMDSIGYYADTLISLESLRTNEEAKKNYDLIQTALREYRSIMGGA